MKKFWGFLLVIVLMTSCGEYQSLLKSNDYNLVYKKAIEYYNKGDYQRAMNLLDGVRSVFVGQAKAQNIAYYRAFCSYNMKDYQIASDLFKQFIQTYPESFAIIKLPRNHVWISRLPKKLSGNSSFI